MLYVSSSLSAFFLTSTSGVADNKVLQLHTTKPELLLSLPEKLLKYEFACKHPYLVLHVVLIQVSGAVQKHNSTHVDSLTKRPRDYMVCLWNGIHVLSILNLYKFISHFIPLTFLYITFVHTTRPSIINIYLYQFFYHQQVTDNQPTRKLWCGTTFSSD